MEDEKKRKRDINEILASSSDSLLFSKQNPLAPQYLAPAINDAIQMYKYSMMPFYTTDACEIFRFFGPIPDDKDKEIYKKYVQKLLNPFDRLAEVIFQEISERNKTHDKKIYFLLTPTTIGEIFWSYYNKSNLSQSKLDKIRTTLRGILHNYDKIVELFQYIKNINVQNHGELHKAFSELRLKFPDTLTLDILFYLKEEGRGDFSKYIKDYYQQRLINGIKNGVKKINAYSSFIPINEVIEGEQFFNNEISPQDLYNETYFSDALNKIINFLPIRFLKDESNRVDALNSMVNLSLNEKSSKIKNFNWAYLIFTRSKVFDAIHLRYDFYMRKKTFFTKSLARKHLSILWSLCLLNGLENTDGEVEDLKRILEGIINFEKKSSFDKKSILFHIICGNSLLPTCSENIKTTINEINDKVNIKDLQQELSNPESELTRTYEMFQEEDYTFLPTKDELKSIVNDLLNFEKILDQSSSIRVELEEEILRGLDKLEKFLKDFEFLLTDRQKKFIENLKKRS